MVIEEGAVISNGQLAQGTYTMELAAPAIAASVKPGQFVNILIDEGWLPLLRRPMSVASRKADRIGLIYKVAGAGAVQIGTANYRDPAIGVRLGAQLRSFLEELGIDLLSELRGSAHP